MNDIMIARIVERLQDDVSTHMHFYMQYRSQGVGAISPTPILPTYYCSVPIRLLMQMWLKQGEAVETSCTGL